MSKRMVLTLCAALMLVPAVLLATDSRGLSARKKKAKTAASQVKSFAFSTEYSGPINGTLVIDGTRYTMTKKTSVYVVGEGSRPQGFSVSHQSIYLAGEQRGDVAVVTSVIVRPKPTTEIVGDGSDGVGVKTEPFAR